MEARTLEWVVGGRQRKDTWALLDQVTADFQSLSREGWRMLGPNMTFTDDPATGTLSAHCTMLPPDDPRAASAPPGCLVDPDMPARLNGESPGA